MSLCSGIIQGGKKKVFVIQRGGPGFTSIDHKWIEKVFIVTLKLGNKFAQELVGERRGRTPTGLYATNLDCATFFFSFVIYTKSDPKLL